MFGFIIGTLCLVGLVATLRARRYGGFAYGGGCHRGYGYGPYDGPHWGPRRVSPRGLMREAFVRLDTTPGQEKAIVAIVEGARDKARDLRSELAQLRKEIAALLGSQALDRTQLDARIEMARHVIGRLGDELGEALSQVHEVLDDRQRRTLSELIADGSFSRSPFVGC